MLDVPNIAMDGVATVNKLELVANELESGPLANFMYTLPPVLLSPHLGNPRDP
jgi:hypothetical protein